MGRFEIQSPDGGTLSEAGADVFFQLGMMYSTGSSVPADLVSAHKWFNISAMRGNGDAVRLRREISELMSAEDVAAALSAARAWLKR